MLAGCVFEQASARANRRVEAENFMSFGRMVPRFEYATIDGAVGHIWAFFTAAAIE